MSSFAADLLVLWVVATAAGAALLALVVAVQGAVTRLRRSWAARRRPDERHARARTC